jgi:hypothetical protein
MAYRRSLDKRFDEELGAMVSLIYTLSVDMTWTELAHRAELSVSCVRNLLNGTTRSPHFRTIYKMGAAVGIAISHDKKAGKPRLRVAA